jgi:hypothetical protein
MGIPEDLRITFLGDVDELAPPIRPLPTLPVIDDELWRYQQQPREPGRLATKVQQDAFVSEYIGESEPSDAPLVKAAHDVLGKATVAEIPSDIAEIGGVDPTPAPSRQQRMAKAIPELREHLRAKRRQAVEKIIGQFKTDLDARGFDSGRLNFKPLEGHLVEFVTAL